MIVAGVNHKQTNMAVYTTMAITGLAKLQGIGAIPDSDFSGSAGQYLGTGDEMSKYLYAYMLARNCTNQTFCFEIPQKGDVSIALSDDLLLIERMYVNPVTHIGSSKNEIILPQVVHFAEYSLSE